MALMTATSFESELSRIIGSRNDVSSRLERWRRDGYHWVARIPGLTEFNGTYERSVNPGTTSFTLPADLRAIYAIRETRPSRRPITLVPRSYLERTTTTAGTISNMAREGRTIRFHSLESGTNFLFSYQRVPTIPSGSSRHAYSLEEWETVHLNRSAYLAFVELFGEERAATRKSLLDESLVAVGIDPTRLPKVTSVEAIETGNITTTFRILVQ